MRCLAEVVTGELLLSPGELVICSLSIDAMNAETATDRRPADVFCGP